MSSSLSLPEQSYFLLAAQLPPKPWNTKDASSFAKWAHQKIGVQLVKNELYEYTLVWKDKEASLHALASVVAFFLLWNAAAPNTCPLSTWMQRCEHATPLHVLVLSRLSDIRQNLGQMTTHQAEVTWCLDLFHEIDQTIQKEEKEQEEGKQTNLKHTVTEWIIRLQAALVDASATAEHKHKPLVQFLQSSFFLLNQTCDQILKLMYQKSHLTATLSTYHILVRKPNTHHFIVLTSETVEGVSKTKMS